MWNNFQLLSVGEITGNYFIHVTSYCNMIYLNKFLSVDLVSTFKIVNLMPKSSNSVDLLIIYNDWVISEKRKKEKKSSAKIFVVVVSFFFFVVVVVFLKKQRYLCCDWNLLCLVRIHPLWFFFFYLGFLSRTFTIHRTAGEGGGYFFKSSLPLPPASQTIRG